MIEGNFLSVAQITAMVTTDPSGLLAQIRNGSLKATCLTFAAELCGKIKGADPEVLKALKIVLRHPKPEVREGALYGLANLGTPEAIDLIRSAESDVDEDVRNVAEEILDPL